METLIDSSVSDEVAPHICQPAMRDPMCHILAFVQNPSPLRASCSFLVNCYANSVYLETSHSVPFLTRSEDTQDLVFRRSTQGDRSVTREEAEMAVPAHWSSFNTTTRIYEHFTLSSPFKKDQEERILILSGLKAGIPPQMISTTFLCDLHLVDLHHVTSLSTLILQDCIRRVEVRRLPKLVEISGHGFLSMSDGLEEVEMENLPELTSVGGGFMRRCPKLSRVAILDLPKCEAIGSNWLFECASLKKVELCKIPSLRNVSHKWMYRCHAMSKIEIKGLHDLTTLGQSCLFACRKLEFAIFEDLPSLTSVGNYWMGACAELVSVRLHLSGLRTVGSSVLAKCGRLSVVDFDLPELIEAGAHFMADLAVGNTSIVQRPLLIAAPRLEKVGAYPFSNCQALTNLSFDFPSLCDASTDAWGIHPNPLNAIVAKNKARRYFKKKTYF